MSFRVNFELYFLNLVVNFSYFCFFISIMVQLVSYILTRLKLSKMRLKNIQFWFWADFEHYVAKKVFLLIYCGFWRVFFALYVYLLSPFLETDYSRKILFLSFYLEIEGTISLSLSLTLSFLLSLSFSTLNKNKTHYKNTHPYIRPQKRHRLFMPCVFFF